MAAVCRQVSRVAQEPGHLCSDVYGVPSVCLKRDSLPGQGEVFFLREGHSLLLKEGDSVYLVEINFPLKTTEKLPSKPAPQAPRRAQQTESAFPPSRQERRLSVGVRRETKKGVFRGRVLVGEQGEALGLLGPASLSWALSPAPESCAQRRSAHRKEPEEILNSWEVVFLRCVQEGV